MFLEKLGHSHGNIALIAALDRQQKGKGNLGTACSACIAAKACYVEIVTNAQPEFPVIHAGGNHHGIGPTVTGAPGKEHLLAEIRVFRFEYQSVFYIAAYR